LEESMDIETGSTSRTYARVVWSAGDIQSLRPSWTDEECEEWLAENEKYIQERLVELGWGTIEALLPPTGPGLDDDDDFDEGPAR
jgi:hypothetical protein